MTISYVGAQPVSIFAREPSRPLGPDADLWEIADALVDADVGALTISDGSTVRGVVSERDLVRALAARRDPATTTANDIAHTRLIKCDGDSTVAAVAEEMMEHYVRHVFVEERGQVVGMVSARDLLGAYVAVEPTDDDG